MYIKTMKKLKDIQDEKTLISNLEDLCDIKIMTN